MTHIFSGNTIKSSKLLAIGFWEKKTIRNRTFSVDFLILSHMKFKA